MNVECLGSIDHVRQVKHHDIVARYDVGIYLIHEAPPLNQQLLFGVTLDHFCANNLCARLKCKNAACKGILLPVNFAEVRNLNYRILRWEREATALSCAFNIKREDAQRCNLRVLSYRW